MAAPISLLNPKNGDVWEAGTQNNIIWTSRDITGNVKIHLFKHYVWLKTLTSTPNTGLYSWNIPSDLIPGLDYQIKIESAIDPSQSNWDDWGKMFFGIIAAAPPAPPCNIPEVELTISI